MSITRKRELIVKPRLASSGIHYKYICTDCRKQVVIKNLYCNECNGSNVGLVGKAFRVPRRNDLKQWKYMQSLIELYSPEHRAGNLPNLGFHKDWNSAPSQTGSVLLSKWVPHHDPITGKLTGGHRQFLGIRSENYSRTKALLGRLKDRYARENNQRILLASHVK